MNIKQILSKVAKVFWFVLGCLYFPICLCFSILQIVVRFLLALTCFGTLEGRRAISIIKSIGNDFRISEIESKKKNV